MGVLLSDSVTGGEVKGTRPLFRPRHLPAPQSQCHLRALSQVVQRIAQCRFHLLQALTVQRDRVGEEALDSVTY